jgi:iron complex outermembrane recepter protein
MNKINLILAMVTLMLCGQASADDAKQYHIPAQPLNNALLKFSAFSGVETLYAVDKMRGLNNNALEGSMTSSQALTRLLQGSELIYRFVDAKTVTVEAPDANLIKTAATNEAQEPTLSGSKGQTLPKVTVEADSGSPYDDPNSTNDPYNTDYNRPNATMATKTDTPIMETPFSVQVVPKQVLDDIQGVRSSDALDYVSGVFRASGSGDYLDWTTRRGFNNFPVGDYRDGMPLPLGDFLFGGRDSANTERVEALKGPASLLYGIAVPGG